MSHASRTNSVTGLPPSPNPSDGATSISQNRRWHKTSLGGMMRNASTISEKGNNINLHKSKTKITYQSNPILSKLVYKVIHFYFKLTPYHYLALVLIWVRDSLEMAHVAEWD